MTPEKSPLTRRISFRAIGVGAVTTTNAGQALSALGGILIGGANVNATFVPVSSRAALVGTNRLVMSISSHAAPTNGKALKLLRITWFTPAVDVVVERSMNTRVSNAYWPSIVSTTRSETTPDITPPPAAKLKGRFVCGAMTG